MAKVRKNIQERLITAPKMPPIVGMEFTYKGKTCKVVSMSINSDLFMRQVPTGVQYGGGQDQYIVEGFKKEPVEMLFYWYRKMQGEYCIILEAIREGALV